MEDYARANQTPVRRTVTPEELSLADLTLLEAPHGEQSACIAVQKKQSK